MVWLRRVARRNGAGTNTLTLILLFIPILFMLTVLLSGPGVSQDPNQLELDNRISEIKEHLDHLRILDHDKSKAFIQLRKQVEYLSKAIVGSNNRSGQIQINSSVEMINSKLLSASARNSVIANLSMINLDIAMPNLYDFLPHLLKSPGGLSPAVKLSSTKRQNVHTVIAIPTIHRPKISYLVTTLRSLIDNLNEDEEKQLVIVVFVAEEQGVTEFASEQILLLQAEFPMAIASGLLEIVVPPANWYPPDLDQLPSTFDDTPDRMKWRTKQNLDYAYLMMYCHNRARYYLQLEDDVITKPGYFSVIKEFIQKQGTSQWLLLEFSGLGFIGKLFRASDVPVVIQFLLIFHREKPVDWLLDHIFYVKYCHPEKTPKQCQQVKNRHRLRYKPSLFQHIGVHSSLKGKVQKLKEKDFGKQMMHRPHTENPPADVSTSLKVYQKYTLEKAYLGDSFFWGLLPQPNDWLRFDFLPPIRLESFLFRSGNPEHPEDRFYNTSVQVKFQGPKDEGIGGSATDDGYLIVAWFSATGTAQATLNTTGAVESLRIVVHTESSFWVIMNELWVKPMSS